MFLIKVFLSILDVLFIISVVMRLKVGIVLVKPQIMSFFLDTNTITDMKRIHSPIPISKIVIYPSLTELKV